MIKRCGCLLLVAIALSALAPRADASVVNGGFENGSLTGWTSTIHGSGSFAPPVYSTAVLLDPTIALPFVGSAYSPITGGFSALLVTMSYAFPPSYGDCSVDVWNIYCPQLLPFVPGGGPLPTHNIARSFEGNVLDYRPAILAQDVVVEAGQTLRWNWAALGEAANASRFLFGDNAWFFATDGFETLSMLARGSTATSASVEFRTSGTWSVYFGVAQAQDSQGYSALLLDDVRIVSTPGSLWLVIAALLALTMSQTVFGRRR